MLTISAGLRLLWQGRAQKKSPGEKSPRSFWSKPCRCFEPSLRFAFFTELSVLIPVQIFLRRGTKLWSQYWGKCHEQILYTISGNLNTTHRLPPCSSRELNSGLLSTERRKWDQELVKSQFRCLLTSLATWSQSSKQWVLTSRKQHRAKLRAA